MPRPTRKRKVVSVGPPRPWGPLEVTQMAEVTEEDKLTAVAFWERHAPPRQRELLRATPRKRKPLQ